MIKLPTQFDARARQHLETAAAGGSTSTCCSSCVVTLGSAVVASSMYLAHLRKRARGDDEDGVPAAGSMDPTNPWAHPEGVAPADATTSGTNAGNSDVSGEVRGVSNPAAPPNTSLPDEPSLLSSTWFWVVMVTLFALFGSMLGDIGAIVISSGLAVLSLVSWVRLHQRAGIGPVQAIAVGAVWLVVTLGAIVLEAMAWMGAL